MRVCLILSALLLAGCASAPAEAGTAGPRRPLFTQSEGRVYVEIPQDDRAAQTSLQMAPEEVWSRMVQVYTGLEIPVTTLQSAERRIGNPGFTVRNRVAGLPAAQVFDCGRGRAGALVAELYPVQVSLHTELVPLDEGGTRVQTRLTGTARDAGGSSTNAVSCSSTGRLEARILERLHELGAQ